MGLRMMMRADAPLLFNPRPSWHKLSWIAEFVANISDYRGNTVQMVGLAIKARTALFEIAEREGIDFDHQRRGVLHFYRSEKDLAHGRAVNTMFAEGGLHRRELSRDDVAALEPAFKGKTVGGFLSEDDSSGDAHKFTSELAGAVARRGGELRFGADVSEVEAREGRVRVGEAAGSGEWFDGIVVCAGVHSRGLARTLGDRVNIYPVKGYSITVELRDAASRQAAPWIGLVDDGPKIATSRLGEARLRIAGTVELNGVNYDIRADRIRPLVSWCERHFPEISTEVVVPWAGLRPMTPSMMPRLGRGNNRGVFYNTGHGHLGWTLAGATARMIAETVAADLADQT